MQPVRFVHKGRGAVSNPQGRFERDAREPVDDGWAREPDDTDIDGAPGTVVTLNANAFEPDGAPLDKGAVFVDIISPDGRAERIDN